MQNNTDAASLQAAAARWAAAFNRGDVDAIVAMYTDDAQLLPEGSEALVGRKAIRDFFEKLMGTRPPDHIEFNNFEFYGAEPAVTERSDLEIRDASGKLKARGKQVLIRVKQNGQWKIHRDMWTNNGEVKSE
jgi:uncharacterized protein (TIGR02246 family)